MNDMRRTERIAVDEAARIEVDLATTDLEIRVGAPDVVEIDLDVRDPDAVEIDQFGSTVTIRARRGRGGRRHGGRISVEVPAGSDLELRTATGSIRVRGDVGAVSIRTASADVAVERARRLEVVTATGDVRVGAVDGSASCTTVSGDVVLGRVAGRLDGSSTSGDVEVERVCGEVDVVTTSGDVEIACCEGDQLAMRSVSGDLRVGLPTGIRVEAELATLAGRTAVPDPPAAAPDETARRLVRLRMRSVSGNLDVLRRE